MNPARQKRKCQANADKRGMNPISIRDIRSENNTKNVLTSEHGEFSISPILLSAGNFKRNFAGLRYYHRPNRRVKLLLQ